MGFERGRDSLRMVITALIVGLTLCMLLGRPLYWQFMGKRPEDLKSCPPCICDCLSHEDDSLKESLADLKDVILPNCGRDYPGMQDELKKSSIQLLQEEVILNKIVRKETQSRYEKPIREANTKASAHQKEFEICNQKMIVSEGAREMAEFDLSNQRKVTILWENRARTLGWKDEKGGTKLEEASPSSSDQMT